MLRILYTLLLWGTPIYQIASSLGGAFSLDKTLFSKLTKMSVIPPEDPDDDRVRHSALGSGSAGAFYKEVILKKSAEFTKAMWKDAVKFYNGTIDEPALRQAIRNWNIDTGYRIEAKTETGPGGTPKVNITNKHSWKEYGI